MNNYFHMLLHLRTMSPSEDAFDQIGAHHLRNHADQLLYIQRFALGCSHMIFKSCTYLKDAAAAGFSTVKLLQKLPSKSLNADNQLTTNASKTYDCDSFHWEFHPGAVCPLKLLVPTIRARKAQGIARQHITKKLHTDPTKKISTLIKDSIE
jgi:hypothetical protein